MNQLFISPLFSMLSAHRTGEMGADTILEKDPNGITVAVISIVVVLLALIVLGVLIWLFSKGMIFSSKQQAAANLRKSSSNDGVELKDEQLVLEGEVIAAIALAVKLHKGDLHDRESEVITINTVARAYSPWSSKIHGLTQMPR